MPSTSSRAPLIDDSANPPSEEAASNNNNDAEPPYKSLTQELIIFMKMGVPLSLSAFLEWGLPPIFIMIMAGRTHNSAQLQAQLGFGRVFFNVCSRQPLVGCLAYYQNNVPGCIGAGRQDRLPRYFQRSMLVTLVLSIPSLVLLQFAEPIMKAVGLPSAIASGVGVYSHWMSINTVLQVVDLHLYILCVNLGYANYSFLNSFLTGVGINTAFAILLIYHLNWGAAGAAITSNLVYLGRVIFFICLLAAKGRLSETVLASKKAATDASSSSHQQQQQAVTVNVTEPLLTWRELRVYFGLVVPMYLSCIAGWGIYEMQMIVLTNIKGITHGMLAAGGVWVQAELVFAAVQQGWISAIQMRTLKLVGRGEIPGAPRSFALNLLLAVFMVALVDVPLLAAPKAVSRLISNDETVVKSLSGLMWVMAAHLQARLLYFALGDLLIPFGKRVSRVILTFVAFWALAAPLSAIAALTDLITKDPQAKMAWSFMCTTMANTILGVVFGVYMLCLDWRWASKLVSRRANTDRPPAAPDAAANDDAVVVVEERQVAPDNSSVQ